MKQIAFNKDNYKIKLLKHSGPVSLWKDMASRKKKSQVLIGCWAHMSPEWYMGPHSKLGSGH